MLAVTGLIMLWASVLVGRDGEKSFSVAPAPQPTAVTAQADAALSAVPGGALVQYIGPRTPEQPAVFRLDSDGQPTMVAVDPIAARCSAPGTAAMHSTISPTSSTERC